MTREEAIKGLETLSKSFSGYKPNEEMFEMAISSLKAQMDGDTISRRAAIDTVKNADVVVLYHDTEPVDEAVEEAIEATKRSITTSIEGLTSAQSEPSQVARDIATIIENEQDMRVILKNAQNDIIHCEDCRFRQKSPGWRYLQSIESSIWYCEKGRGLNFAETVELDDYCSSAKRRTNG